MDVCVQEGNGPSFVRRARVASCSQVPAPLLSLLSLPPTTTAATAPAPLQAWCPNAVMAVHRDRARLRPRSFYAALQEQLGVGSNTEAGHFTERSWASIFFVPAAFAGCQS